MLRQLSAGSILVASPAGQRRQVSAHELLLDRATLWTFSVAYRGAILMIRALRREA